MRKVCAKIFELNTSNEKKNGKKIEFKIWPDENKELRL